MPIDRGGLRYEIEVVSKNLDSLRKLRAEIKSTLSAQVGATQAQVAAARQAAALAKAQAATVAANARAGAAASRAAVQYNKQAIAQAKLAAQQAKSAAAANANAASNNAAAASVRNVSSANNQAVSPIRRYIAHLFRHTAASQSAAAATNQLLFSMRRLIGTLAIFQAARAVGGAFIGLIKNSISFNASIETANIGIAGLISNIGKIRNSVTGELVPPTEKFAAALELSSDFTKALRADAIRTTATFEELARAAQEALAPALSAGLSLDEARKVSVLVSQAASALNIQQNQLGEELRSLLGGTATARTTRVAAAFGVTADELNKLVREAKAAGRLFEFIQERLKGTAESASLAALSFNGLTARIKDALGLAGGAAAEALFADLKKQLVDIIELLVPKRDDGEVIANPRAVRVLSVLFVAIRDVIIQIRSEFEKMSESDWLGSFTALASILRSIGIFAVGFIRGLLQGFADVAAVVSALSDNLSGLDTSRLADTAALFGRILVSVLAIQLAWAVTAKVLALVVVPLRVLATGFAVIAAIAHAIAAVELAKIVLKLRTMHVLFVTKLLPALSTFLLRFVLIPAAIAAAIYALGSFFKSIFENLLGVSLSWKQFGELLVQTVSLAGNKIEKIWTYLVEGMKYAFNELIIGVTAGWRKLLDIIQPLAGIFSDKAANAISSASNAVSKMVEENLRSKAEAAKQLQADLDALDSEAQDIEKKILDIARRKPKPGEDTSLGGFAGLADEAAGALLGADSKFSELLIGPKVKAGLKSWAGSAADFLLDLLPESMAEGLKGGWDAFVKGEFDPAKWIEKIEEALGKFKFEGSGGKEALTEAQRFKLVSDRKKVENEIADLYRNATAQRVADLRLQLELLREEERVVKSTVQDEEERNLKLDILAAKIGLVTNEARKLGNADVQGGITAGIDDFIQSADPFVAAQKLMSNALSGFADALAGALTEPKDAGKRLLDFFKSLVQAIIAEFLKIQIAKLLVSLGAGSVEGGPVGTGKVHGGPIRGYADGGSIHGPRPSGLDPRDTVPIWAQPGEFMQPVSAVRAYGHEFMEALRSRALPPGLMRALGALATGSRVPKLARSGPGFATGGEILPAAAAPTGGGGVIEIRSSGVVNDGLTRETLRAVAPGIKEPRNVIESKGGIR